MFAVRQSIAIGVASAMLAAAVPAAAEVLTFDDLGTNSIASIPASYHGLTWDYWYSVNGASYGPSGYANGVVSGGNSACACAPDFGQPYESISSATSFTLNSGYFTSAWNDGATLTVIGLSGASTLFSTTATLNTTTPTFLTFNWSGIDSVQFSVSGGVHNDNFGGGGDYFAVDNLSINAGAVPEPAAWALIVAGFGLVGAAMRRRATAAA